MKILLWCAFAIAALLWTTGAWLVASVASWVHELARDGAGVDWEAVASSIDIPAWVTAWFDPGWVLAAIDAVVHTLQAAWSALPWLDGVVGWIAPLTWFVWAVGAGVLLLGALFAHWGIGRLSRPGAPAAA